MSTLGLKRPSEDIVAAVAQVLVLQLVAQDLLGEARFIALHGRRRGRFLCGHGVCIYTSLLGKTKEVRSHRTEIKFTLKATM